MKTLYLIGSIFFTVLILILSFENIQSQCSQLHFLFFSVNESPTIVALGIAIIGIITGALYHAYITKALEEPEEQEEDVF